MGMGVAEFSIAIGKICIFPISCVYLRSIQYPNFLLQTISIFCYKIMIPFICHYNGNTRLNYVNPRLTSLIRDLLKSQAISCQLDFNSCLHFCNLHPHARKISGTNDTSRNITGFTQFPI